MTKRLFFAINLSEELKKKLGKLTRKLERGHRERHINWVSAENLHITVHFLGDVDEGKIGEVSEVAKKIAANNKTFTLKTQMLGCFPHNREPRIMMLETLDESGTVNIFMRELGIALQEIGMEIDLHKCHPHITLGRVKDDEGACDIDVPVEESEILVKGFDLMESHLSPEGAKYTVVESYLFA